MGAPDSGMQPAEQATAEALLSSFKTISGAERRRHASVYNYWLSIRGSRDFPALRDLDPLEISDAGPCSVLLQLISGGQDAEIQHIGETLKADVEVNRIADAPRRSLLSSIGAKLAIVAISRDPLSFEDEFETAAGTTPCRITLLPFSSTGAWVDYVYGFVTMDGDQKPVEEPLETPLDRVDETLETSAEDVEPPVDGEPDPVEPEPEPEPSEADLPAPPGPGFSMKGFDPEAGADNFYGTVASAEPEIVTSSVTEEYSTKPVGGTGIPLQDRLAGVRAKADEARLVRLQSEAALHESLSAAYDFALDADDKADEYLKIVEAKGLKIQLRSPMTPVVKLAFDGLCDEATIAELEGVLAWALKSNLPRGSLAERIEAEGGIGPILNGPGKTG